MTNNFSIVLLTYNNYQTFERCMKSMFTFLYHPDVLEIIVLDNGSEQRELLEYLSLLSQNLSKLEVIFSPTNLGVSGGRKKLFSLVKGDYVISIDSDIVLQDGDYMLSALKNHLQPLPWEVPPAQSERGTSAKNNNLFLIGGGGGKHIHFPSLYISDVVNLTKHEDKNKFVVVDEVAGWCQCFRRTLLEKVEMDDRYGKFWGEDSDFCIQIKHLGGRCAIFGKGVIDHTWSSCRTEERRADMPIKWEMVLEKWNQPRDSFPHFDKDFYREKYEVTNPIQDYFSDKIFHGYEYGPYYKEYFSDRKDLSKYYYKIHSSTLDHSGEELYIIDLKTNHNYTPMDIEDKCVIFIHHPDYPVDTICVDKSMHILLNIDVHDQYTLLLILFDIIKNYDYENVVLHHNEKDVLSHLDDEHLFSKDLKFNRKGIKKLYRASDEIPDDLYEFDFKILREAYYSYPIKKMLQSSLMIPFTYDNIVSPEYSPKHILPELFLRIYTDMEETGLGNKEDNSRILTIIVSDEVDTKYLKGDILHIDTSYTINEISPGVKWYHRIEDYKIYKLFKFINEDFFQIYDYNILVYIDTREYDLVGDITEFYTRSFYQNTTFIEKDLNLFSIHLDDLEEIINICKFFEQAEGKKINNKNILIERSIYDNINLKLYFSEIWKKREEDEIIIYYRDDDKENLINFPLIQKNSYL